MAKSEIRTTDIHVKRSFFAQQAGYISVHLKARAPPLKAAQSRGPDGGEGAMPGRPCESPQCHPQANASKVTQSRHGI